MATKKPIKAGKAKAKPQKPAQQSLPGDLTEQEYLEHTLRVNHAGEFGAQRIYQGQLAVLKNSDVAGLLEHMAEQEQEHLEYFEDQLIERRIRPTALYPLWNAGGWLLGAGTALLGKEAAMACTVAVEEVIDEHYAKQLEKLGNNEKKLKAKIKKFQADELEHRDIGLENDAELAPGYQLLLKSIKGITKSAIWLSKRI